MRGCIGTSMQGREYYKRPDKIKANCKNCGHCKRYDNKNNIILCGKWDEWKHGTKRLCRWFFTYPQKAHGSECTVNGAVVKFLNKNLHFHVYYRELPDGEWIYLKKVYAFSENNAICKAAKALRRKPKKFEYKAEIHGEDIESIQTFGENNIPKIIWKKKEDEE